MFDLALARQLALTSSYVYGVTSSSAPAFGPNEAEIATDDVTAIAQVVPGDGKATSFAAVLRYPDRTVLAFQGTIFNSFDDWLDDFRAEYNDNPAWQLGLPGKIHEGFAHQLAVVSDQILAALANNQKPLYITGHSQGAAQAVLATAWLSGLKIPVAATYTFAAPRAGDSEFVKTLAQQAIYRVEFGNDIVPHVPLPGIEMPNWVDNPFVGARFQRLVSTVANGYVAAGSLVYRAFALNDVLRSDWSSEDEAALTIERRKRLARAGALTLANHMMANYIAMLDDNLWSALAKQFAGSKIEDAKEFGAGKVEEAKEKLADLMEKIPKPKFKLPF